MVRGQSAEAPAWRPVRPSVGEAAWGSGAGTAADARGDGGPGPQDARGTPADDSARAHEQVTAGPEGDRPASRTARILRRLGPGPRLGVAFAAFAVVTALVALGGVSVQPTIGTAAPWNGVAVDDLRAKPVSRGWSTDLARVLAPDADPACVGLVATPVASGRVLVTTENSKVIDQSSEDRPAGGDCTAPADVPSAPSLALFDPVTGRVGWHRTFPHPAEGTTVVGRVLPTADPSRVLVQVEHDGVEYVTLDLSTGKTVDDVGSLSRRSAEFDLVGFSNPSTRYLLMAASDATADSTARLVSTTDVGRTLWTGLLDPNTPPLLTTDSLIAATDGRSFRVDGRTGRATPFAGGRADLTSASVSDDVVYAHELDDGVARSALSAWTSKGRKLWTTETGVESVTAITRSCILVTPTSSPGDECLDRATGAVRWSAGDAPRGFVTAPDGMTDDTFVRGVPQTTALATLTTQVVDGDTGMVRYDLVGELSQVAYGSRTVGYSVADATDAARGFAAHGYVAFDLLSGRRLWRLEFGDTTGVDFWAGHLVGMRDGVVTGYHDPSTRSSPALAAP